MHVRTASGRHQHVLEAFTGLLAERVARGEQDLVAPLAVNLLRAHHFGLEAQVEFLVQGTHGRVQHLGVAQVGHAAAAREDAHAHAEAGQGLAQFQPDHARADHGHRAGQIVPVKHVVAGDDAWADVLQLRQHHRRRPGGDHEALRFDFKMVVDAQGVRAGEPGMAADPVCFGKPLDALEHEADKPVALAPHAFHHGAPVDAFFARMHAEARRHVEHVGGVGGGNQELARHAADAGAGGAVVAAFDDDRARALRMGRAVGGHARGAGADHGDVDCQFLHTRLHGVTIRRFHFKCRAGPLPATSAPASSSRAAGTTTPSGRPATPGATATRPATGRGRRCRRASSSSGSGR